MDTSWLAGFVMMAIAAVIYVAWLRRVTDYERYAGRAEWRFLEAPRRSRGRLPRGAPTGRWLATRVMTGAGLVALVATLLLGPTEALSLGLASMGPTWNALIVGAGWAGLVLGNVWLYRTMRASPEPDARSWRYRA